MATSYNLSEVLIDYLRLNGTKCTNELLVAMSKSN